MKVRAEALLWVAIAALLAVVLLVVRRPGGVVATESFTLAHVALSAAVALVTLRLARRAGVWVRYRRYYLAFGNVVLLGGALELAQCFVPGDPSLRDLLSDLAGGAGALLLAWSIEQRKGQGARAWRVRAAAIAAWGMLGSASVPSLRVLLYAGFKARAFPALLDFDAAWETEFVRVSDGTSLTCVEPPPGFALARGEAVGRVVFGVGDYPKLELSGPHGHWSSFDALVFEVYSPSSSELTLHLRIRDHESVGTPERYLNEVVQIAPGESTVRMDLKSTGRLDFDDIESVALFLNRPRASTTLYFDSFRLE